MPGAHCQRLRNACKRDVFAEVGVDVFERPLQLARRQLGRRFRERCRRRAVMPQQMDGQMNRKRLDIHPSGHALRLEPGEKLLAECNELGIRRSEILQNLESARIERIFLASDAQDQCWRQFQQDYDVLTGMLKPLG